MAFVSKRAALYKAISASNSCKRGGLVRACFSLASNSVCFCRKVLSLLPVRDEMVLVERHSIFCTNFHNLSS